MKNPFNPEMAALIANRPRTSNAEQNTASRAFADCPLSMIRLLQLCEFTIHFSGSRSALERTGEFIRMWKLPKRKTLDWLTKHKINSDFELITQIYYPLQDKMFSYLAMTRPEWAFAA
jgi:hypothetical protein